MNILTGAIDMNYAAADTHQLSAERFGIIPFALIDGVDSSKHERQTPFLDCLLLSLLK
jgi:hypothetical protein